MPDDLPEPDAHGFRPTRMVRVKLNQRGFPTAFLRCWMKPDDLGFPSQWRDVGSEEFDKLMDRYVARRFNKQSDERLTAGADGVCLRVDSAGAEEVGGVLGGHPEKELCLANE